MKIPFHKPMLPKNLDILFSDSIRSGWLTTGPMVKEFETQLSDYLQAEHVIAVNSGTAALHLALAAKGFQSGYKFIAPTYTFAATVGVGEYLGMEPILVDCGDHSYNIDLDQVETILKKEQKVVAILPVHFAGQTVDMVKLKNLAETYGVFVVEDAAHALEGVSNAGKIGNTNDATAFSFYANKNITTGGEGGALSTNDSNLADKVRMLTLHGMSKHGWERYSKGGKWEYDIKTLGFKYNMSDVSASFGLWQLKRINQWKECRIEIVKQYLNGLKNTLGCNLPEFVEDSGNAWHLFVLQIEPDHWRLSRNELIEKLNEEGIEVSVHFKPVHMLTYYQKHYGFKEKQFPRAKSFFDTVITLPLYPSLQTSEVEYIIDSIHKLYRMYKI